ncbi:MAG: hypothetical protein KJ915_07950 [Candidatus Omnitrophica bacterium]|nr:hypothetical protein [Candidatus Omnitrophota bacterium]
MKKIRRELAIFLVLVLLSVILYFLHYAVFHDKHHILIFGLSELAFLPLEVLVVTAILHRLLELRDKQALFAKKNMLIGTFFSEIGINLLRSIVFMDRSNANFLVNLKVNNESTKRDFKQGLRFVEHYTPELKVGNKEIIGLKDLILSKKPFLSDLIQHPILLEHKSFTDLLLSTYHLAEELNYRSNLDNLSANDMKHLVGDIERIYKQLLPEWIEYMRSLKNNYPYLFSLYIRLNPFIKSIDVTIN